MSKSYTKKEFRGKTTLSAGASTWVKNNVRDLEWLPDPSSEWLAADVDQGDLRLDKLQDIGLIEVKGSRHVTQCGSHKVVNVYKTKPKGYQAVLKHLQDLDDHGFTPCPCGHRGISNLGDGNYGCLNDDCDETYTRDEVDV